MRKAFRHTGVLMMMAVVAPGLMGGAYALWFENLTLTANVSTGSFDVNWSADTVPGSSPASNAVETVGVFTSTPVEANLAAADFHPFGSSALAPNAKYIQSCSASLGSTGIATDANDGVITSNLLTLNLNDLYPYAGCEFNINIDSTGSVPAHLALKSVTDNTGGADLGVILVGSSGTTHTAGGATTGQVCTALLNAILGPSPASPTPLKVGAADIQLHQNDQVNCDVIIYLKQSSDENVTGATFSAVIEAHQWNENAH